MGIKRLPLVATLFHQIAAWRNSYRQLLLQQLGVEIGERVTIDSNVDINLGFARQQQGELCLGDRSKLSRGVTLHCYGGSIILKENVFLGSYAVVYGHGGVTIKKNALIATHCQIFSSNHTIPDRQTQIFTQPDILLPTTIGEDVWLGAGSTILGGVNVGDGCVVGAGAVVTKDIPPYSVVVGVPAKVVRMRQ